MTPVIPCSVSNISFIHGHTFTTRKNTCFTRYNSNGNPTRLLLSSQRHFVSLSQITAVSRQLRNRCSTIQRLSAIGTDIAVEEQGSSVTDEASVGPPEVIERSKESATKSDASAAPVRAKKRQSRKSEMPPVKKEDLVPGATFIGKIRTIQPFGAFVDFGAFTDGLVHLSQLSDGFVKDVNDVVSLGQEVKVRLIEVNDETGRISLSMRDDDSSNKPHEKKDGSNDKPRLDRRDGPNKSTQKREGLKKTKFVLGQDLVGTVKNFGRSGAFISLPDGEEGFLPTSEEPDDGFGNVMGNSSLEVGQEVNVRVLRISRGTVTLTMKKEEDVLKLDSNLKPGVVNMATNPFVVAFRRNKDIAAFLDDREKHEEEASAEITPVENAYAEMTSVGDASPEISSVETSSKDDSEVASVRGEKEDPTSKEISSTSQGDTPVVENVVTAQISDASSADDEALLSEASSVSKEIVEETQAEIASVKENLQVEISSDGEGNGSVNGSGG